MGYTIGWCGYGYLDNTEAIAAKRQVVDTVTETAIAKVKRLLAMEGGSGIGIWNAHLAQANSVHDAAPVIADVVQHRTFTRVEGDAEAPLLPLNQIRVGDAEAGALGLHHGKRLEVLAGAAGKQLRDILGRSAVVQDADFVGDADKRVALAAGGGLLDADELHCAAVDNGDKGQRVGIKVGVGVAVALVLGKAESLEKTHLAVGLVGAAIGPGLDDELEALGELD